MGGGIKQCTTVNNPGTPHTAKPCKKFLAEHARYYDTQWLHIELENTQTESSNLRRGCHVLFLAVYNNHSGEKIILQKYLIRIVIRSRNRGSGL